MGRQSIEGRFDGSRGLLSGWKEIAHYLHRGIRTVQRYEREFGLPVRRPAGKLKGVVATKAEIDAWIKSDSLHHQYLLERPIAPSRPLEEASIQDGIKQMRTLLRQMEARKTELATALAELNTTISGIQGQRRQDGEALRVMQLSGPSVRRITDAES